VFFANLYISVKQEKVLPFAESTALTCGELPYRELPLSVISGTTDAIFGVEYETLLHVLPEHQGFHYGVLLGRETQPCFVEVSACLLEPYANITPVVDELIEQCGQLG